MNIYLRDSAQIPDMEKELESLEGYLNVYSKGDVADTLENIQRIKDKILFLRHILRQECLQCGGELSLQSFGDEDVFNGECGHKQKSRRINPANYYLVKTDDIDALLQTPTELEKIDVEFTFLPGRFNLGILRNRTGFYLVEEECIEAIAGEFEFVKTACSLSEQEYLELLNGLN